MCCVSYSLCNSQPSIDLRLRKRTTPSSQTASNPLLTHHSILSLLTVERPPSLLESLHFLRIPQQLSLMTRTSRNLPSPWTAGLSNILSSHFSNAGKSLSSIPAHRLNVTQPQRLMSAIVHFFPIRYEDPLEARWVLSTVYKRRTSSCDRVLAYGRSSLA